MCLRHHNHLSPCRCLRPSARLRPRYWHEVGETLEAFRVSVRVYVTGRVRIESGGRLVDDPRFPARQGRVLFAYLVCRRQRPVTRTELAEMLWPGRLPAAWDGALNALFSKMRVLLKRS